LTASDATARVVFLDVARFLAIGLMTFAHVVDSLLLPAEWKSGFGAASALTRGSTAPLFLLVGGWAFAVASRPHLDAYRRPGPKLLARLSRVLTLCLWGWVLTMPWWHPRFPHGAPEDTRVAFTGLSAPHCVGLSLLVAQGPALATRTPQQLERALFRRRWASWRSRPSSSARRARCRGCCRARSARRRTRRASRSSRGAASSSSARGWGCGPPAAGGAPGSFRRCWRASRPSRFASRC
jgi:hypothetical protein